MCSRLTRLDDICNYLLYGNRRQLTKPCDVTILAILAMFIDVRYFYLRLHYTTVKRDQMQRPKEGTARNKFNQTRQSSRKIIRHAR